MGVLHPCCDRYVDLGHNTEAVVFEGAKGITCYEPLREVESKVDFLIEGYTCTSTNNL